MFSCFIIFFICKRCKEVNMFTLILTQANNYKIKQGQLANVKLSRQTLSNGIESVRNSTK